jgi:hypothetical protein
MEKINRKLEQKAEKARLQQEEKDKRKMSSKAYMAEERRREQSRPDYQMHE